MPGAGVSGSENLANTTQLIRRYRGGDTAARDQLVDRYLPMLRQWARGRLPHYGREMAETDDLVQITFLRALNKLETFESEKPGAFLAYLRTILLNAMRDEIRRGQRKPNQLPLSEEQVAAQGSIVENLVGSELLDAYESALGKLGEVQRLAVIMRVEFGMTYPEIAVELERPSTNATRMLVTRALKELAASMPE